MNKYDSLTLKNQLCFPIYLCSKEIIRRYTPLLDDLDLTYTQYITMMYLWEHNTSNVKDISDALFLDSGTLTPLLKKLEAKEYITRTRSLKDERNLDVTITKKGLALRDKALLSKIISKDYQFFIDRMIEIINISNILKEIYVRGYPKIINIIIDYKVEIINKQIDEKNEIDINSKIKYFLDGLTKKGFKKIAAELKEILKQLKE